MEGPRGAQGLKGEQGAQGPQGPQGPEGSAADASFLNRDGSNFMTAPLNRNEERVKNMSDPVNKQDSVNKRYLESHLFDYVKRNGSEPMTFNLDMANYRVINTGDPQGGGETPRTRIMSNSTPPQFIHLDLHGTEAVVPEY